MNQTDEIKLAIERLAEMLNIPAGELEKAIDTLANGGEFYTNQELDEIVARCQETLQRTEKYL